MAGLDPWHSEPERPRWRRRRRKWYVKLVANLSEQIRSMGWKSWSAVTGLGVGAVLFVMFDPLASSQNAVNRGEPIECLVPGQSGFEEACSVEESSSPDGKVLTVRSPDGEFRRLLIVSDGRGLIAADGAEEIKVKPAGSGKIDVSTGDIVWRLPARVRG
jgi:hypothetical protein